MRLVHLLSGIATALALSACGAEEDAAAPPADEPATSLLVSYAPDGRDGERTEWQLRCDPPGGTHGEAEAACAKLRELEGQDPFAPVPDDAICTMIYGGPAHARVEGVWRGETVDAEFTRENGCEIARWDQLVPLLPAPS